MKGTLKAHAKQLKLSYIKDHLDQHIEESEAFNEPYEAFLEKLFEAELKHRRHNSIQRRLKLANFPYPKYLDTLDFEALPQDLKHHFKALSSLKFLADKQNLILAGNPGTGKTHTAIGLGIKAAEAGHKVYFAHVPSLIVELKEAKSSQKLHFLKRRLERYPLIILDELGYISFDYEGSELLFNLISTRNERSSTIITTNLSFSRWQEIFKDPVITAAMVDRLTHHSYVIDMNGTSYRYLEQKRSKESKVT